MELKKEEFQVATDLYYVDVKKSVAVDNHIETTRAFSVRS
jgi:hypothetical protein